MRDFKVILFAATLLAAGTLLAEPKPCVAADREDAIYAAGDVVTFNVLVKDGGSALPGRSVAYDLKFDGKKAAEGVVKPGIKPAQVAFKMPSPGWLCGTFTLLDENGKPVKIKSMVKGKLATVNNELVTGAMADPGKLLPARDEPEDFDAFWAKAKAELATVPLKSEVKQLPSTRDGIDRFDVTLSCVGDKPVRGYLVRPAGDAKLPAVLRVHGAGVRSSRDFSGKAASHRCMMLDINAHGIENGQPAEFYNDLARGALRDYKFFGMNDRDTVYFKRMYQRVLRALEYLKSRPDWDGKNLVVWGVSQGGAQSLAGAALDYDVTGAIVGVPALCDHAAKFSQPPRQPGWPRFSEQEGCTEKTLAAVAYYDGVFFARRIRCPIVVYTGFADRTCVPTSVFTMYNQLPESTEKHIYTTPAGNHGSSSPARYGVKDVPLKMVHRND